MNEDTPLSIQESTVVYENPWIKLREDKIVRKNGEKGVYSYLEVEDSVCIVAVDHEGRICLVESYRHPSKEWFWELPAGGGEGGDLIAASKRELKEEAGITAQKWVMLGKGKVYHALSTEYQLNVLATELSFEDFVQKEDETRARKFVTLAELEAIIQNDQLEDNQTIVAIYMYKNWLQKVDAEPAAD